MVWNILFFSLAAVDFLFLCVILANEMTLRFRKRTVLTGEDPCIYEEEETDDNLPDREVSAPCPMPPLSKDVLKRLKVSDAKRFAEERLLSWRSAITGRLNIFEMESATLLLSAYLQYLILEAPACELNFGTLLELLKASEDTGSMDKKDCVERLMESSFRLDWGKPMYYGEYLLYKATCEDKEKVIGVCRELAASILDDLELFEGMDNTHKEKENEHD